MKKLSASLRHWVFASLCLLLMSIPTQASSLYDGLWKYVNPGIPVISTLAIHTYSNEATAVFNLYNMGSDMLTSERRFPPPSYIVSIYGGYIKDTEFRGQYLETLQAPVSIQDFLKSSILITFVSNDRAIMKFERTNVGVGLYKVINTQ